jgi:hypothetical protein
VFPTVAAYEEAMTPAGSGKAATTSVAPAVALAGAAGSGAATTGPATLPATRPSDPVAPMTPAAAAAVSASAAARSAAEAGREAMPDLAPTTEELRPRSAAAGAAPVAGVRRRRFGVGPLLIGGGVLLAAALVIGGVAAYLLLPAAAIVVTPRQESVGPVEVTVTADPEATRVDVAEGTVPADRRTYEVEASGTYPATGVRIEETTAGGTVRWTNCDPTDSYTIPAGTVVRTRGGIAFTTNEQAFLPVAILELTPPALTCQDRDVGVEAADAGPAGNVDAGTITVVPAGLNSNVIAVTNPAATSGGTRETFPQVTEADIETARADLATKLDAAFAAELASPDAVPPGLTLFPETGDLGEPVYDDTTGLAGSEVAEFDLGATATGTAIAVDEEPVGQVAEATLRRSVDPGYDLVAGSVESTIGDPTVDGELVIFPASATAKQIRRLDPDELETEVLGLSEAEAIETLSVYGDVEVELSPDWVTTVPSYSFRVDLTIATDTAIEPASPEPGPSAPPSRRPGPSPSPSSVSPSASPSPSPTPS